MRTIAAPWLAMLVAGVAACSAQDPSTRPPPSLSDQIEAGIGDRAGGRSDGSGSRTPDLEETSP